jgi:MurNAc alpha-1-phosphate uridylyltransferase
MAVSMKAMLLAAGRGERMRGLTAGTPKPLLKLGAETLIERQLRCVRAAGITEVIINLSYEGHQIRRALGDGAAYDLRIAYSDEGTPPLETGGGIIHALPLLGTLPFLLINADVVTDLDFGRFIAEAVPSTLVLVANPYHNPDGDFGIDASGRASLDAPRLTYAGISVLEPKLFEGFAPERRPLKPILDATIARGDLRAYCYDGLWLDAGTPDRLRAATAALARIESP